MALVPNRGSQGGGAGVRVELRSWYSGKVSGTVAPHYADAVLPIPWTSLTLTNGAPDAVAIYLMQSSQLPAL